MASKFFSYSKQDRNYRKDNQKIVIFKIVLGLLLIISIAIALQEISSQNREMNRLALQEQELLAELQQKELRGKEIAELSDQMGSDEFIEKIARDELGLIAADEYIFVEE